MRERMFATLGIWAAVAFSLDRLMASLRYTVWTDGAPQSMTMPDGTIREIANQIANVQFVGGWMQFAVFGIMFLLVLCATGATVAIWQSAAGNQEQRAALQHESTKAKRSREMRVRRLLSAMDEDELAALEEQHLNEDDMTVAQLIQQRQRKQ